MWYRKLIFPIIFLLWCTNIVAVETILHKLALKNPQILNNRITANGTVWDTYSKRIIMSSKYDITLAENAVYYSDGTNTFLCSNDDGHLIAQISGTNFKYNSISRYLWNYSNGKFSAYTDSGLLITNLSINSDSIFTYPNEIRYNKSNQIYKYVFSDSNPISIGDFSGTFSSWFIDGEYFLTKQGTIVRLYDKNATLIKLIDMPETQNLGGSRKFIWSWKSYPYFINLYRVDNSTVSQIPFTVSSKIIPTYRSIAILPSGYATFKLVNLDSSTPDISLYKGSGPSLESFNTDMAGNWTTSNSSGVVNYSMQNGQPTILNYGNIRTIYGNTNGHGAISTSSGQVLIYKLNGELISLTDTFNLNSSKIKLSADGKYLASQGSNEDSQYSENDRSLSVNKIADHSLIKKWYYAYNSGDPNNKYLFDFDFSNDGTLVTQLTGTFNSNWSYTSNLTPVNSNDIIYLNSDGDYDNQMAPLISPSGEYVASSMNSAGINPLINLIKIYVNGILNNAFTGKFGGWINNNLFAFNAVDTVICTKSGCTTFYKPIVCSVNGQIDTSYKLPFVINNLSLISDSIFYVNNKMILNVKSGDVLFGFDTVPTRSAAIGKDHILFIKDNALKIINWRNSQVLNISANEIKIDSIANSIATFNIISNMGWKVSSNENWLVPNITNGYFNRSIKMTAAANTTGSTRTATITISGNGVETKKITVRQPSKPTKINNLSEPNNIVLYPNPVKSSLHVLVDKKYTENCKIEIFNSIGELVGSYKIMSTEEKINLQHLSKGIYAVVIYKNNLREFSKMVVKE